ncbi:hypothetical protein GCM10022223_59950 [Kineosporia mesophila]|uniref:Uncharacterized protein n=1 Tax=Kineosporia mesophila TaxID=566012 RepID=A0ABP7AJN1_9ACTN
MVMAMYSMKVPRSRICSQVWAMARVFIIGPDEAYFNLDKTSQLCALSGGVDILGQAGRRSSAGVDTGDHPPPQQPRRLQVVRLDESRGADG